MIRIFLRRAKRKLKRLRNHWVPYNLRYRPRHVHVSSWFLATHVAGSGCTYVEVVPEHTSTRALPDGFYEQAPDYGGLHSKPVAQEEVPAAFVVALPRGRVYADNPASVAVIAADNWLVGDVSFQYANTALAAPEDNSVFTQWYFKPLRHLPGTVCSLLSGGGAASGNYYHWLIDSLPRLHLVRAAGLLDAVDYFLVYDRTVSFVAETLGALGIAPERIADLREGPHIQADRLLATSAVRGAGTHAPAWAGAFLRSFLLPAPAVSRPLSPYVYISRRDAPGRRVRNEVELEAMLTEYGFVTHVLTPYSHAEKTALFAQAQVIVSPVGAGLANLVVCPPGSQLLELFPETVVVADYFDLAVHAGMGYQYLVCASPQAHLGSRPSAQRDRDDLTVDLRALRPILEQALARAVRGPELGSPASQSLESQAGEAPPTSATSLPEVAAS